MSNNSDFEKLFNMDVGLTGITVRKNKEAQLPENSPIQPSEQKMESQVMKILYQLSLDQKILSALAPKFDGKEMLINPHTFETYLTKAIQILEETIKTPPKEVVVEDLEKLLQLLKKEKENALFLHMLRMLVLAG